MKVPDPLDGERHCFRPMLPIEISVDQKIEWVDALIDSGADYNTAPSELAEVFEINLENYPKIDVGGIEQAKRIALAMVPVVLKFGGHSIETYLGFGGNLPNVLLGQRGFFDRVKKISFEYPKDVEIKPFTFYH